jgi:hypothetical protein
VFSFQSGYKFGAFASSSWRVGPKFFGDNNCFLFNLSPKLFSYESARFNTNYQYMNLKQKTMPNGIGKWELLYFISFYWSDSALCRVAGDSAAPAAQAPRLARLELVFAFG